jgi:hypothetical protein
MEIYMDWWSVLDSLRTASARKICSRQTTTKQDLSELSADAMRQYTSRVVTPATLEKKRFQQRTGGMASS